MIKLYIDKDNQTVTFTEQTIDIGKNSITYKGFSATFELITRSYIGMTSTENFFHFIEEQSEVLSETYTVVELCENVAYKKPLFDLWLTKENYCGEKDFETVFFLTSFVLGDEETAIRILWMRVLKNYYLNEEHVFSESISFDVQYTLVHYKEDDSDNTLKVNFVENSILTCCDGNCFAVREKQDRKSLLFWLASTSHKQNIKIIRFEINLLSSVQGK